MMKSTLFVTRSGIAGLTLALASTQAFSHAYFVEPKVAKGTAMQAEFVVPHGCDTLETKTVAIKIPADFLIDKVIEKKGWKATAKKDKNGRIGLITYSDGRLAPKEKGKFVLSGTLSKDLAVGQKIYVPIVQDCGTAKLRWVDIPNTGGDKSDNPAPFFEIVK